MKKLLVVALALALLMGTTSAFAEMNKDETVYTKLSASGVQEATYVVNHIETPEAGTYIDYGVYAHVSAMVRDIEPELDGDTMAWSVPADPEGFYSVGILEEAQPPFLFDIVYSLDGAPVEPDALAGQTGRFGIDLSVRSNPRAAEAFRTRFFGQVQIPLPSSAANVYALGSAGALVGKTRNLTYTVLPGKDADFSIAFDAEKFEMDAITITAIPMSLGGMLGIDMGGMAEKATGLGEGATQLAEGNAKLVEGLTALSSGLASLAENSASVATGMDTLGSGVSQVLTAVNALPESIGTLAEGSATLTSGATTYIDSAQQALSGANQLLQGINTVSAGGADLVVGMAALSEGLKPMMAQLPKAQQEALKIQLTALTEGITAYTGGVSGIAAQAEPLALGIQQLAESGTAIKTGLASQNEGIATLSSAVKPLAEGIQPLLDGVTSMKEGTRGMAAGIAQLSTGAAAFPESAQALAEGQAQMLAGIQEAFSLMADMPVSATTGDEPIPSFVSPNHTVRSLQFVYMTEAISVPADEVVSAQNTQNETFLSRLIALFK